MRQSVLAARVVVGATLFSPVTITGCSGEDNEASRDPSDGPGVGPGASGGQVTAEWEDFCVATFTRDYAVIDVFGDNQFTVRAGEEYLLADFGAEKPEAELVYLFNGAPYSFGVEKDDAGWPFTSNCETGQTSYYAVFRDTAVFKDEAMADKACDLAAGTVVPLDSATFAGYSATSFSFADEVTYNLSLNALADSCGGVESGYIDVSLVEVLGTSTYLVPVLTIIGPIP